MAQCIKLKKESGQQLKEFLHQKDWLEQTKKIGKTQLYLLIPINDKASVEKILDNFPKATLENRNLETINRNSGNLKSLIKEVIPEEHVEEVNRSFDQVGDIAILDIPEKLDKFAKSIAWTLFRSRANIEIVAKRSSKTKGKYRIREITPIVGKRTETIHKEHGVRLKVDLNKAYFTPRLSTERLRIAKQVKPHEDVLVMFAGVGPYPLVILRRQRDVEKIVGIELNPDAIEYFKENIKLNKRLVTDAKGKSFVDKIILPIHGDVKKEIPKLKDKFDRIIMILPAKAEEYLDDALKVAKKGCIIHLYRFAGKEDMKKIKNQKKYKGLKILHIARCGDYAPGIHRICLDLKVE